MARGLRWYGRGLLECCLVVDVGSCVLARMVLGGWCGIADG